MPRPALLLLLAFVTTATAQDRKKEPAPKLLYSIPLVAKPGEKQKLTLRGKGLATVKEVRVAGAVGAKVKLVNARAVGVPNNYPVERLGDSEVEIELELPKDVKPGTATITATSPDGESNAYPLLVRDTLPAVVEKEPNDGFAQAQIIPLPGAVEGTIRSERDVDVFQFSGKKGGKLRIEIQAARFGSPVDAFLTLHDSRHRVIASADDTGGTSDPVLVVTLPADGAYLISVIDANDLGGPPFGYRLVVRKD